MLWLIDEYQKYNDRIEDWQRIREAGVALNRIIDIWHNHGWVVPPHAQKDASS